MKLSEPTKMCANPECARTLPLSDFYARSASSDGHQSWCKTCSRQKRSQWADRNREHLRELHRGTHYRRMADPERAGIERVRKREWERQSRGTQPENYRMSVYMRPEAGGRLMLSADRLASWFDELIERDQSNPAALGARLGIWPETVRRIVKGQQTTVELAIIERALVADDTITLRELYPDWYAEAAA